MARLMVSRNALIFLCHHTAALFGPGYHLDAGLFDVLLGNGLTPALCSQQGRFVHQVFQIGAREAGGRFCNGLQHYIRRKGLVARVHAQNFFTALNIRQAYIHLAVKPAGAQQGFIQNIGAVGGGNDNDALVGGKAIHLHQQLVQRLLALVVAAAKACAALAAHGVNLVNKHNARRRLFRLFEQIAHARSAHAHIHLHKVRAGNGIERHARLARARARQQRFARARRAHQQHAVRNARTQRVKALLVFQKLHNFGQLFLFLIGPGHIGERGFAALVGLVFHLGAPHVHGLSAAALGVYKVIESPHHHQGDDKHGQHGHPNRRLPRRQHIIRHGGIGVFGVVRCHIIRQGLQEN